MLARAKTRARRHNSGRADLSRRCEAHKQWIRGRECAFVDAGGCRGHIQAAHVRLGTDGGTGIKPSDVYCWPACEGHHGEQHQIGEPAFAAKYGVDLVQLATSYAKSSPHWLRLREMIR